MLYFTWNSGSQKNSRKETTKPEILLWSCIFSCADFPVSFFQFLTALNMKLNSCVLVMCNLEHHLFRNTTSTHFLHKPVLRSSLYTISPFIYRWHCKTMHPLLTIVAERLLQGVRTHTWGERWVSLVTIHSEDFALFPACDLEIRTKKAENLHNEEGVMSLICDHFVSNHIFTRLRYVWC